MKLFFCQAIKRAKNQKGYFLLELLLAMFILAMATVGISMLFLYAENAGMYAILQNRTMELLRVEAEVSLAMPYANLANKDQAGRKLLPQSNKKMMYTMDIHRTVFVFPNADNPTEPSFKIVNIQGVWTFRGRKQTNYIQTISVP